MTAPTDRSAARILADWTAGLRWADVPATQHPLIGLRLLDTLGLILAGASTEAAAAARHIAERQGVSDEAGILPQGGRAAAAWAAFVHGVTAHCRDFDDTFQDSVVHPGSVVVPAALAVGEAKGATDAEIATAIVAGYEVAARLGRPTAVRAVGRAVASNPLSILVPCHRVVGADGGLTGYAGGLAVKRYLLNHEARFGSSQQVQAA